MKHLILENIILLLMGMTLASLLSISTFIKKKKRFYVYIYLRENVLSGLIALIGGFASLMMSDALISSLGVAPIENGPFYLMHSFASGFCSTLIMEKIKKFYL